MSIYLWSSEPSKIYVGSSEVSAVYVGTEKVRPSSRLPSAYQEVEYIQSSGTQYIDTWLKLNYLTTVDIDIAFTANRSWWTGIIWAQTYNNNHSFAIWISNSWTATYQNRLASWNRFVDFSFNPTLNQKYWISANWKNIYVDWVLKWTFSDNLESYTTEYNARIFSVYQYSSWWFPYNISARLYSCKIYDNWTIVRDFVPCYRISDNLIWLYDLVHDAFYTNAGSWTFAKWNNVNVPKLSSYTITSSSVYKTFTPTWYSDIQWCYISDDWTKMYISFWNWGSWKLVQYTLATPNDVSSAVYVRNRSLTKPDWIYFSNDWTKFFVWSENGNTILRYTLSTAWDISTAAQDQSISLTYFTPIVNFSEDWKYLFYWWRNTSTYYTYIYRAELSTAWDLTTITQTISKTTNTWVQADDYLYPLTFNSWTYLLLTRWNWQPIKQYWLARAYDFNSTNVSIWTFSLPSEWDSRWLFIPKDVKYWITATWSSSWTTITQYLFS